MAIDDRVVSLVAPHQSESLDEVIDWLREHEKEGNIHKLSVVFEDKDRKTYSRSMNLLNKDYAYFLMEELIGLFMGGNNG